MLRRSLWTALALFVMTAAVLAGCSDDEPKASLDAKTCEVIGSVVLATPTLGAGDQTKPADDVKMIKTVAAAVPKKLKERWNNLVKVAEKVAADPSSVEAADAAATLETLEATRGWATESCPSLPPSWACITRRSSGEAPSPPKGAKAAKEAKDAVVDQGQFVAKDAVELDSEKNAVLYGWLRNDSVVATQEVQKGENGTWKPVAIAQCS